VFQCAKSNRRRIAEQRQTSGGKRFKTESDQHGSRDGDWRSESSRAFNEGAKTKGDEQ